jgi:hypothetical protein
MGGRFIGLHDYGSDVDYESAVELPLGGVPWVYDSVGDHHPVLRSKRIDGTNPVIAMGPCGLLVAWWAIIVPSRERDISVSPGAVETVSSSAALNSVPVRVAPSAEVVVSLLAGHFVRNEIGTEVGNSGKCCTVLHYVSLS